MKRRNIYLLLAVLVPLLVMICWSVTNRSYPFSDAAEMWLASWQNYRALIQDGFGSFVHNLYFLRMRKPVALCPFGTLGLILTDGDILWAVRIVVTAFFTCFLVSAFYAFELLMAPAAAALATVFLGVLPWYSFSAHYYGLEIPVLFASTAGIYWLVRCKELRSTRDAHRLAFFLAFGLCLRPTDILLFFFVPILYWIRLNLREKRITFRDILIWCGAAAPFVAMLLLRRSEALPLQFAILCIPATAIFILRKKLGLNPVLSRFFFLTYILVAAWYAPFLPVLYGWMFQATYGGHAHHISSEIAGWHLLLRYIRWLCGLPIIPVVLAAALGWKLRPKSKPVLFMIAGAVVLPLVVGSTSHDLSTRYYFASAGLLFSALLYFALAPQEPYKKLVGDSLHPWRSFAWFGIFEPSLSPLPHVFVPDAFVESATGVLCAGDPAGSRSGRAYDRRFGGGDSPGSDEYPDFSSGARRVFPVFV